MTGDDLAREVLAAGRLRDQPTDWTAGGQRPAGQPGEVQGSGPWPYPAVRSNDPEDQRVWYWRDERWHLAQASLRDSFVAGPEWQSDCDHGHAVPCDTQADCDSLTRELERLWGR